MKNILVVLALALTATAAVAPSVGPKKGALVIVGGGRIPPVIAEKFIALAGGPNANVVYIPTAAEDQALSRRDDADSPKLFGLKNVTVLHTRNRAEAYLGTRVHEALRDLLRRGGVIGGTSAGATIQGSYLVRGAREGNHIMMAKGYEIGLGFLRNIAIDQHIDTRKREPHLSEVVTARPELLGIGLYESTAIVVQGDRFEVIGEGKAAVTDGLDHDGRSYYLLSPGDRFDLKARRRR